MCKYVQVGAECSNKHWIIHTFVAARRDVHLVATRVQRPALEVVERVNAPRHGLNLEVGDVAHRLCVCSVVWCGRTIVLRL